MKRFKKLTIISLFGLFLIALPLTVWAASNQSIYVGPDEIIDGNFIRAGATIDINGAINGDVIVAGNSITIAGPVAGDVIAAGNTIRIKGPVGGSVRVVGSSVVIDSEVEKNVWAVGNTVSLSSNSKVGWDFYSAAAAVEAKGPVGGNVWANGASIIIGNTVGKDVAVSVDQEGVVVLYPEARVSGNLTYKAEREEQLILKEGAAVTGEIKKNAIAVPSEIGFRQAFGGVSFFFKLVVLFSLLVIGLVLVSLFPKIALEIKEEMIKRPAPAIGWGLVYLILTPIVVVLLMFTIIGLPLALIILPLYLISLWLAKVFAGFTIGSVIFDNLSKDKKPKASLIWPLAIGMVIFVILTGLPFIGWLIKLILTLWALGAIIALKKGILKEYR